MRILEEHYLRDDIGLGTLHGSECSALTPEELVQLMEGRVEGGLKEGEEGGHEGGVKKKTPTLTILDTNVALEQIDFLENAEVGQPGGEDDEEGWGPQRRGRKRQNLARWKFMHDGHLQASEAVLGVVVLLQTVLEEVKGNSLSVYR